MRHWPPRARQTAWEALKLAERALSTDTASEQKQTGPANKLLEHPQSKQDEADSYVPGVPLKKGHTAAVPQALRQLILCVLCVLIPGPSVGSALGCRVKEGRDWLFICLCDVSLK
jgi:hypothetical protein